MKKTEVLLILTVCLIASSCTKKENLTVESKTAEEQHTVNETVVKKQNSFPASIDNSNLQILNNYEFNFGYEEYYRIYDGIITSYFENEYSYRKNYSCTFNVNEHGFLIFTRDNKEYTFIDHDIYEIADFDYERAVYKLNEKNVITLTSDGYFSEIINGKLVEYKIDNLKKSVMYGFEKGDNPIYTNPVPFVTKRGNSGVGEVIKLQTLSPLASISILPGYVNTKRQDLFYKNNRPKKIEIRDLNSCYRVIAELSDIAVFQTIELKHPVENMEIEILEVYPGTKYDDTCISGLLINPVLTDDSEYYSEFIKESQKKKRLQEFEFFIPKPNEDKSMGTEIRNGKVCALRGSTENLDFDIQFPDIFDATKFWNLWKTKIKGTDFLQYYNDIASADKTGTFDNWYFQYKIWTLFNLEYSIEEIKKEAVNHPVCVFGKYSNNPDENEIILKSGTEVVVDDFYEISLANELISLTNSYHYIFSGIITDIKEIDGKVKIFVDNSPVYVDFDI